MDDRLIRLAKGLAAHLSSKSDHYTELRQKDIEKWFQVEAFFVASQSLRMAGCEFESHGIDLVLGGGLQGSIDLELKAIGDRTNAKNDLIKEGLDNRKKGPRAFMILTWGLATGGVQLLLDEWVARNAERPYQSYPPGHPRDTSIKWRIFIVPPARPQRPSLGQDAPESGSTRL